jgi:hypothetical protein
MMTRTGPILCDVSPDIELPICLKTRLKIGKRPLGFTARDYRPLQTCGADGLRRLCEDRAHAAALTPV